MSYSVIFFPRASANLTENWRMLLSSSFRTIWILPWPALESAARAIGFTVLETPAFFQVKKYQTFTHQRVTTPSKPARAKPPWRAAATPPTSCQRIQMKKKTKKLSEQRKKSCTKKWAICLYADLALCFFHTQKLERTKPVRSPMFNLCWMVSCSHGIPGLKLEYWQQCSRLLE